MIKKIFNLKKEKRKSTRLNDVKTRLDLCACSFYYFFVVRQPILFFFKQGKWHVVYISSFFFNLRVNKKMRKRFFNLKNTFSIIFYPKTYKKQLKDTHKLFYAFKQPKNQFKNKKSTQNLKTYQNHFYLLMQL